MGGINSLSGLNNVNVDFRPTITTNVQNKGNANQLLPGADAAPENVPQPERAEAKSVVRELDVLLLNAAGKSVSANAVENVKTVGESLVDIGVLTEKEKSKLQSLAEDGSLTIDFAKVKSPEVKMAIVKTLGMQCVALPEEIDQDFYNKLMEEECF